MEQILENMLNSARIAAGVWENDKTESNNLIASECYSKVLRITTHVSGISVEREFWEFQQEVKRDRNEKSLSLK